MKRALVAASLAALLAGPALAADVFRTPFIPTDLQPREGAVVVALSVFDGSTWATEQVVIHPGELSVDCDGAHPPVNGG